MEFPKLIGITYMETAPCINVVDLVLIGNVTWIFPKPTIFSGKSGRKIRTCIHLISRRILRTPRIGFDFRVPTISDIVHCIRFIGIFLLHVSSSDFPKGLKELLSERSFSSPVSLLAEKPRGAKQADLLLYKMRLRMQISNDIEKVCLLIHFS